MTLVRVAAVDLGASSGRVMLGAVGPATLQVESVARFANDPVHLPDGLHWNLLELYAQAVGGLRAASAAAGGLVSVGIDSWAVDYGLIRGGRLMGVPYHYRDDRTARGVERVHATVAHQELYRRTGVQFLPFNTVYQLAAEPDLGQAEQMLLIPDLLAYWLTGHVATERTNASTTGLLDLAGEWHQGLIELLGYPQRVFAELVEPGTCLGGLLPNVAEQVGDASLVVTAVGSHDTASAVVAVPMQREDAAYISGGTWGLVGVELERPVTTEAAWAANFTNERGVGGRTRFLTNVMGTWLLSETLRTWQRQGSHHQLTELLAAAADVPGDVPVFDVQDPRFAPPGDMPTRIAGWFAERQLPSPVEPAILVRCIVESLAQAYAQALHTAERLSGHTIGVVHMVGGASQNRLLCQAVADRSGREVIAGPVEATALGNVLVQAAALGAIPNDLAAMRRLVADCQQLVRYRPVPRHDPLPRRAPEG